MKQGPENEYLRSLIVKLERSSKKNKAKIWEALAEKLRAPKRKRTSVNLYKINKNTKVNDVVVVPGKVLGEGSLDHIVTIAAWNFSKSALNKVSKAGGKCIEIPELIEQSPKGTNVKIMQ
ncbi:50S ribosomal protein L18e [Candidatus Micrarchaeota archaeon]|nr:50S ribosomal protein L18e [Candidatus Micrarchaeota archaeon]